MPRSPSTQLKTGALTPNAGAAGPPKVFLSHASEDKDRFVVDFATRLRQRGIDVWLDQWEMLPGDSLVRKIFDEGLARAVAVIVVISKHSVAKPWVREELDIAVVKKINSSSKLIPVVIDDCAVPVCLQATIWEKIDDLGSYEPSLERIVLSIFGQNSKPPVGAGPAFDAEPLVTIGDLTRVDSLVLKSACEECLATSCSLNLLAAELIARTRQLDLPDQATWESVEVLKSRGLVIEQGDQNLQVTYRGFELYLKAHQADYEKLLREFASVVVNERLREGEAIEQAMQVPKVLLRHMTEVFTEKGWLIVERYGGGNWEIPDGGISPELERWLES
jgi:hypothetical protein